jgi:hypothetical protein
MLKKILCFLGWHSPWTKDYTNWKDSYVVSYAKCPWCKKKVMFANGGIV